MRKKYLDNKTLDRIGRKLFERDAVPAGQIDLIVVNPQLFDLVRSRIAANHTALPLASPARAGAVFFVRQKAVLFASVAILTVGAIGTTVLISKGRSPVAFSVNQFPDAVPEVARPEVPPEPFVGKLSAGRALKSTSRRDNVAVRRNSVGRVKTIKIGEKVGHEVEFYPVGSTGDPAETAGGGRIIRVDMSRSSLFALGVNLPLENEDETVKTDLLIGSDGVTRGVRVVN